ncbi:MAG: amidoligase family protein [Sulfurimonas sp.]|jgi:hypothetical protein|nr:amidoligase family protein [Sulfurimonas sp.]
MYLKTIQEILKISWPEVYDNSLKDDKGLGESIFGIEIEVENIVNNVTLPFGWEGKEDGSLRNNGVEFITSPAKAKATPFLLTSLKSALEEAGNIPSYSPRTSIHIHLNVLDFTVEQLKSFVLLYLCFESVLFKYVGGNRKDSIFCIPLSHAGYVGNLKRFFSLSEERDRLYNTSDKWHKYTSLNLKPMCSFGTIEFRHMPGTDDIDKLIDWITLIIKVKEFSLVNTKEEVYKMCKDLNTSSQYEVFTSNVFGEARKLLTSNLQKEMENDITHIKECFEEAENTEIDFSLFETSSLFKVNEFVAIDFSERTKYLMSLSKEALTVELQRLSSLYAKALIKEDQEKILIEYREVEKVLYNFDWDA